MESAHAFPVGIVVIGAAVVALMVLVVVFGVAAERRRAEEMRRWAQGNGWRCVSGDADAGSWRGRLAHLSGFGVRQVLSGTVEGWAIQVADCSYVTHHTRSVNTGQSRRTESYNVTHNLVVAVCRLRGSWPSVTVEPRGLGSRMWRALTGGTDPDTGNPEFDAKFKLRTDDTIGARRLLPPQVMAAHVAGTVPPWSLWGGELLVHWEARLAPAGVLPGARKVIEVATLLGARP